MAVYQGNVGEAPPSLPWASTSGNGDAADQTQGSMLSTGVTTSSPLGDPDSSNPPGGPDTGYSSPDAQIQGGGNGETIGTTGTDGNYSMPDGTVAQVPPAISVGATSFNTSAAAGRGQTALGAGNARQVYAGQNAPGFFETLWDWASSTSLTEKLDPRAPNLTDASNGVSPSGQVLDSSGKPRPGAQFQPTPSNTSMPTWEKALIAAGLIAAGAVVVFGLRETKGLVTAVKA